LEFKAGEPVGKVADYVGVGSALATAIAVFVMGYSKPAHNWDMIGYVAAAHQYDGVQGEDLRQATFNEIKAEVTPNEYLELTGADPRTADDQTYPKTVAENPVALEQSIRFYSVRPFYIWLTRTFAHNLGTSYARATYTISAIFAASSVLVLYLIFFPLTWLEIILFPAIIFSSGFGFLAKFSTPDALAGAVSLAALLALSRQSYWTCLSAVVLPLVRPDYVLLSLLLGIYVTLFLSKKLGVATLVTSGLTCLAAYHFGQGYGWLTQFNVHFFKYSPFPADMIISHQIGQYLSAYYACIRDFIQSALFIPIVATGALIWEIYPKHKNIFHAFLISLGFFALFLLVFPDFNRRYFTWFIALTFMTLIRASSNIGIFGSRKKFGALGTVSIGDDRFPVDQE
jgi:hypothetical protein